MNRTILFLLLFTVTSCALFDKYEINQFTSYHRSLTEQEKKEIMTVGKVFKKWNGTNNKGDYEKGVLEITRKNQTQYNFIQIGEWETLHKFRRGDKNLGVLKQKMTFDSLGNLLTRESYIKPKTESNFYLAEKVTSAITDDKKFGQKLERINSEGWLMYIIIYEYTDYLKPNNDRFKDKKIRVLKYYDKDGKEVPEYYDKEIDGLIKRVRMKD